MSMRGTFHQPPTQFWRTCVVRSTMSTSAWRVMICLSVLLCSCHGPSSDDSGWPPWPCDEPLSWSPLDGDNDVWVGSWFFARTGLRSTDEFWFDGPTVRWETLPGSFGPGFYGIPSRPLEPTMAYTLSASAPHCFFEASFTTGTAGTAEFSGALPGHWLIDVVRHEHAPPGTPVAP